MFRSSYEMCIQVSYCREGFSANRAKFMNL